MTKLTQPLKWHGGKMYLADWIISLMPPHLHYVETHFGGGAVLLARDHHRNWMATNGEKLPAHLRGCSEVVNDINGELANFWRVLKDEDAWLELAKLLELTPLSSVLFEHLRDASDDYAKGVMPDSFGDEIARAWWFFVKYRQSRQGLGKDFATLSRNRTRGGRNEQANAWLSCLEGLPEIHERLKGVVILNADAIKVIKQQDGEHTLFYCDPPYLHKTRSSTGEYGKHEMTEEQHCELLMALNQIKGKFMLSGYHSDLYDAWAKQHKINCHECVIDNKASSKKEKEDRIECIWCNF